MAAVVVTMEAAAEALEITMEAVAAAAAEVVTTMEAMEMEMAAVKQITGNISTTSIENPVGTAAVMIGVLLTGIALAGLKYG